VGKNRRQRANTAAPWLKVAIPRSRARFRERKAWGGRAEHDELTPRENGAEDGPRAACGSGWRAARVASRMWPLWDDGGC
jgi:hypothetical protein